MNYVKRVPRSLPTFVVVGKDEKKYVAECRMRNRHNSFWTSAYAFFDAESGKEIKGWWKKRKLGIRSRLQAHLDVLRAEIEHKINNERRLCLNDYVEAVGLVVKEKR